MQSEMNRNDTVLLLSKEEPRTAQCFESTPATPDDVSRRKGVPWRLEVSSEGAAAASSLMGDWEGSDASRSRANGSESVSVSSEASSIASTGYVSRGTPQAPLPAAGLWPLPAGDASVLELRMGEGEPLEGAPLGLRSSP